MTKRFQRTIENFVCEKCGHEVVGNGYTNHCPKCLWSKHVDVNPGDRAAQCGGIMKPVSVSKEKDDYIILHTCEKCGHNKNNKASKDDDFDAIVELSQSQNS